MNISGKFMKVAETKKSIVVGTVGALAAKELTYDDILHIARFYGINVDPDKFNYHMITADGAKKEVVNFR